MEMVLQGLWLLIVYSARGAVEQEYYFRDVRDISASIETTWSRVRDSIRVDTAPGKIIVWEKISEPDVRERKVIEATLAPSLRVMDGPTHF